MKTNMILIALLLGTQQISAFAADRLTRVLPEGGANRWLLATGEREKLLSNSNVSQAADGYYLLPKSALVTVDIIEFGNSVRVRIPPLHLLEPVNPSMSDVRLPQRIQEKNVDHLLPQMDLELSSGLQQWLQSLPQNAEVVYKDVRRPRRLTQTQNVHSLDIKDLITAVKLSLEAGQEAMLTVRTGRKLGQAEVDAAVAGLSFKVKDVAVSLDEKKVDFAFPEVTPPGHRGEKIPFYAAYDWIDRDLFPLLQAHPEVRAANRPTLAQKWRRDFIESAYRAYFKTKAGEQSCISEYYADPKPGPVEGSFDRVILNPSIGEIRIQLVRGGVS